MSPSTPADPAAQMLCGGLPPAAYGISRALRNPAGPRCEVST